MAMACLRERNRIHGRVIPSNIPTHLGTSPLDFRRHSVIFRYVHVGPRQRVPLEARMGQGKPAVYDPVQVDKFWT